jgi:hypothetical protein
MMAVLTIFLSLCAISLAQGSFVPIDLRADLKLTPSLVSAPITMQLTLGVL